MTDLEDYYQILGVDPKATSDEIRAARNRKAMDFHPDRLSSVSEAVRHLAEEQLKTINRAYEALSDARERSKYDSEWFQTYSPPNPLLQPSIIRLDDATPGESHTSSFTIQNQGGTYTRLWFSDPDSWLKVTGYASVDDADELPLRVDLQLTGLEWDKSYVEAIIVRLDDVETTVRVELHTKTAPAPVDEYLRSSIASAGMGPGVSTASVRSTQESDIGCRIILAPFVGLVFMTVTVIFCVIVGLIPWIIIGTIVESVGGDQAIEVLESVGNILIVIIAVVGFCCGVYAFLDE